MRIAKSCSLLCALVISLAAGCAAETEPLEPIPAPSDVAAIPGDASRTGSGLAYRILVDVEGEVRPTVADRVNVDYTGWTTDGVMFDSSVQRGLSSTFAVDEVIAGWTEGLQLMSEGDEYRFWIPQNLAYRGVAGRPQGMLVFDVHLIQVYPSL